MTGRLRGLNPQRFLTCVSSRRPPPARDACRLGQRRLHVGQDRPLGSRCHYRLAQPVDVHVCPAPVPALVGIQWDQPGGAVGHNGSPTLVLDVMGAEAIGMRGVLYDPEGEAIDGVQLIRRLDEILGLV